MGTGRGKTRRASGLQPQLKTQGNIYTDGPPTVIFQREKWLEFLRSTGVQSVKLQQYYLGRTAKDLQSADYEKIVTELFADAVASGALTLPAPHKAEDFKFQVTGIYPWNMTATLASLGSQGETLPFNAEYQLGRNVAMARAAYTLKRISFLTSYLVAKIPSQP